METDDHTWKRLVEGIDPEIVAASQEVDRTLIRWIRSLPPLERVAWTLRTAAQLSSLQPADD